MRLDRGGRVGRAIAAGALLLTVAACGGRSEEAGSDGGSTPEESPSASETADGTTDGAAGEGATAADCTGETQDVEAAQGVSITVPADWRSEDTGDGVDVRLSGPVEGAIEGQVVVQAVGQALDDAVADVEKLNSQSEKTSDEPIELEGFAEARALTFAGSDFVNYSVVGVADGVRAIAYTILEESPDDEPLAAACMLTLRR